MDLSTTNFPVGIFHLDNEYAPTIASDSCSLGKYNKGHFTLTDKDGVQRIEKAYVQTQTCPYLVHTLYGENTSTMTPSSAQPGKTAEIAGAKSQAFPLLLKLSHRSRTSFFPRGSESAP